MTEPMWQESVAEIWKLFKETDARLDKLFQETQAQFKETDQKLNRLEGLFGSQWGKMMEALVEPAALRLFQERGIQVNHIFPRSKSTLQGRTLELDLILENESVAIVIEVKSRLKVDDVNSFLADMAEFFHFFPRYRTYHIYAGVAGLDIAKNVDRYAYRQGLFVLSFTGEGVVQIKNDAAFRPKDFAASTGHLLA